MTAERVRAAPAPIDDQATRLRRILGDTPTLSTQRRRSFDTRDVPARPATIAVASGKGGVGKSVLSLSIAAWLSRRTSVTLVDADFGAANLDVMLGLAPMRRLDEAFQMGFAPGHRPVDLAIEVSPRLRLVPGVIGSAFRPDERRRNAMTRSLDDFEGVSETLVVDAAAGVDASVTDVLAAADCPLIVTTSEPTAMADAYALLKSLSREAGPAVAGRAMVAVNLVRDTKQAERVHRRIAAVSDRFLGFRPPLAGLIPWDRHVPAGVQSQRPAALTRGRGGWIKAVARLSSGAAHAAREARFLRTASR